jgi:hypothetical protein
MTKVESQIRGKNQMANEIDSFVEFVMVQTFEDVAALMAVVDEAHCLGQMVSFEGAAIATVERGQIATRNAQERIVGASVVNVVRQS